jgi:hypothetical protein
MNHGLSNVPMETSYPSGEGREVTFGAFALKIRDQASTGSARLFKKDRTLSHVDGSRS